MFWNIPSYNGEFRVDSPQGSMNWGIGCIGANQTGEGYYESWGAHVQPRSLYLQQLKDRLGERAVDNVAIPEQQSEEIQELLVSWRGQGDFSEGGFYGDIPQVSFINPTSTIDVSVWKGSDIQVDATDNDGTIQSVKLLINGEPVATDHEAPYLFTDLKTVIQNLSHEVHYLQVIAVDNDGNTNGSRTKIIGGDPPLPNEEIEEEEQDMALEIRIFPNPSQNGELTIEMKEEGTYIGRIFDMTSRQVYHFRFDGIKYQLTFNSKIDGIYILEIQDIEGSLFKRKVIIQ